MGILSFVRRLVRQARVREGFPDIILNISLFHQNKDAMTEHNIRLGVYFNT